MGLRGAGSRDRRGRFGEGAAALRGRRTSGKKARTLAGIATDVGRLTEGAMKAEAVAARARRRNMVASVTSDGDG